MKLGILSDIHSNLEALEAVLAALRDMGATRFVCCGDVVGYGPDPDRCIDVVRGLGCVCVAGNHDWAEVGSIPLQDLNPVASSAVLWTQTLLTEPNRLYLENLPITAEDHPFFIVHSSPSAPDVWKYVLTVREAGREMKHFAGCVCVVGHSHRPFAAERLPGRPARLVTDDTFNLLPNARYFINAGSVGQPRDGDPRACCLLYDDDTQAMTYLRVPYDIPKVQAKISAAGLPEYLASRLEVGR